jgi:adenylosuccinate synthase
MPSNLVVIGAQWGDEGKGKIVDLLTERAAAVVRFQGGHNAGHTLVIDGPQDRAVADTVRHPPRRRAVLHRQRRRCSRSTRCCSRPTAWCRRESPSMSGCGESQLPADPASHVALDRARERARGANAIGTTGRGIGPAYEDKVARRAVRVADLFQRERLAARLGEVLDFHNFMLQRYFSAEAVDFQRTLDDCLAQGERIMPLVDDVTLRLHEMMAHGNILFEGAQGALLDVDVGTYPYVTSSNTIAGEAAVGTGLGPRDIHRVLGIVKAYTTRVGAGPFPTELFDETGEHLSRVGHEFGAVTGRPRRCGWFDAVALRRAVMNSSISCIGVTKLDVLDGLDTIRICIGYRIEGELHAMPPDAAAPVCRCGTGLRGLAGWSASTQGITDYAQLPETARRYLARIEELAGVPIDIVSTGADRAQTIVLRHPFA